MRRLGYATVAVLRAIAQGARYGLDIMDATGLSSGTVYPTLTRMENRGLLSAAWESNTIALREGRPRRRYYKLTAAGSTALSDALRYYGALGGNVLPQGG
jgi:DNA-binding PadR family transcriptional regulator